MLSLACPCQKGGHISLLHPSGEDAAWEQLFGASLTKRDCSQCAGVSVMPASADRGSAREWE